MSNLGELRRILGPLSGVAVSVGVAVGAGILRTPGEIAAALPSAPWIFAVWTLGAVVATLDALILAEMATSVPRVGGLVAYVRLSFGPLAAFLVGWSMLLVTWPASLAAVAVVVGEVCVGGVGVLAGDASASPPGKVVAIGVVVGALLLNALGLRAGTRAEIALLLLKVTLLVAVLGTGLWFAIGGAHAVVTAAADRPPPRWPEPPAGLLAAVGGAMLSVLFSYDGYADAVYLAGETRDPGRAMPRALFPSLLTITALYLFANAAFLAVLGVDGLARSPLPALDVARAALGRSGETILTVVAVVVLLGAVNAYFLTGPRIARVLAEEGLALPVLGRMSERGAARGAGVTIAVLASCYVSTGSFQQLLQCTVPLIDVTTMLVAIGLLVQRRRAPLRERPFRTPMAAIVVGAQVLLGGYLLVAFAVYDLAHGALALTADALALVLGLLAYGFVRQRARRG